MNSENRIFYRDEQDFKKAKLTIEGQLQLYERHPERSERSSILWHAWRQNKGWLTRLLELTLASFPSYSRHNASHAEAVLYNIERILGEKRIKELSATDCFAILHTVYVHDIGMAILAEDRKRIIVSDEFVDMVDELAKGADEDLRRAALRLQKRCYNIDQSDDIDYGGTDYYERKQKIYSQKLETYYDVIYLLAEFQRKKHGENAASKVKDWISDGDKLQSEFAMSGIPMRIFLRIADCASLHTDWEFQHILDLPHEENGYENDMLHPRFVAVLLQLGDALDIDNDRFHPFAQAFLDGFPMQSQAHYDKHRAIRTLKVTPEEIIIEADCENREAMRLVKNECDALEDILKSSSYYWSSIAPKGFSGALPSLKSPKLLLKGKAIPVELSMMRFQISQRKAFSLLQGKNIYSGAFPFVRELIQNAIDSTKIQCYQDYITSSKFRYTKEDIKKPSITNISDIINPVEYPIEIEICCAKENALNEWSKVKFDEIPSVCAESEKFGILFSVRDYGTGIDRETLTAISDVGTSYQKRKKLVRSMPDWLRPTGEFGIGLQSVFLITDKFYCETYVRNGERYKIEFRTGANGEKGYINVEPKGADSEDMAYGTEFQLFISHDKKKFRDEFLEAWPGFDPFAVGYEGEKIKRDIVELTSQILLDIDRQLEELLFPVYTHLDFNVGDKYLQNIKGQIKHLVLDSTADYQEYNKNNLKNSLCWMYKFKQELNPQITVCNLSQGICMIDIKQMEVYLWLEKLSVSAKIGVGRIVKNIFLDTKDPCHIYYKGIWIESQEIKNDLELLEYIDIQGSRSTKSFLQLSRNGFTEEGEKYIHEVIVPKIFAAFYEALKFLSTATFVVNEKKEEPPKALPEALGSNLKKSLNALVEPGNADEQWKLQLAGISFFYHFFMLKTADDREKYFSKVRRKGIKNWEDAIERIIKLVNNQSVRLKEAGHQKFPLLINVVTWILKENKWNLDEKGVDDEQILSLADFFDRKKTFAVISKRRYEKDGWLNTLVLLGGLSEEEAVEGFKRSCTKGKAMGEEEDGTDNEGMLVFNKAENTVKKGTTAQSGYIQWLLKYVPVAAMFSDYDQNLRIHIISGRSREKVVYNNNSKFLFIRKMAERRKKSNAQRFCGSVWDGYDVLRIKTEDIPDDVCSVSEKYTYANEAAMIFPCIGDAAEKLIEMLDESKNDETAQIGEILQSCFYLEKGTMLDSPKELLEAYNASYQKYCSDVKKPVTKDAFLDHFSLSYIRTVQKIWEDYEVNEQFEEKLTLSGAEEFREELYKNVLRASERLINETGEEIGNDLESQIKKLAEYCYFRVNIRKTPEYKEFQRKVLDLKQKEWDVSSNRANLVDWTVKMNKQDRDAVEECYDLLWNEIEEIVIERWEKNHSQKLDNKFLEIIKRLKIRKAEKGSQNNGES